MRLFVEQRPTGHAHYARADVFGREFVPGFERHPFLRQACYLVSRTPLPGEPKAVSLRDLASLPLVLPSAPNLLRAKLDRIFAEAGLAPNVVAEGDGLWTILQAVQTGVGCAVLAKGDFSDVAGLSGLVAVPIDATPEEIARRVVDALHA